jgi:hypothetical protein
MTEYKKQYLTWDQTDYQIQWDNNPYTWDEVFILIEIAQALDGGGDFDDIYGGLDKKKKQTLIKLVARVNGKKFEESKYKQENIKVIAKNVKIAIKEVLNIDIDIKVE